MEQIIEEYIERHSNKRFEVAGLERYVQARLKERYFNGDSGYREFAETIVRLVDDNRIKPIRASKQNGLNPPLFVRYEIVSEATNKSIDANTKQKILYGFHPKMNMGFYLSHPEEYQQDAPQLESITHFLREGNAEIVTVNERSFQLFHKEKFLADASGRKLLNRIGVTFDDLRCEITYEPFMYYESEHVDGPFNILIVENKDTYDSFVRLFSDGYNSWGGIAFSMVIYGEGHKIERSSFPFYHSLRHLQRKTPFFYYYGDLDREGISIWYSLCQKHSLQALPMTVLYKKLFEGYHHLQLTGKEQAYNLEAVNAFVQFFDMGERIHSFIRDGYYIPQEGLNRAQLRDLAQRR